MVAGNSSISRAVSLLIGVYLTLGGALAMAGGQSCRAQSTQSEAIGRPPPLNAG